MDRQQKQERLDWHRFSLLERIPGLVHAVFTRHGGVSQPPYASLNAVSSNGDSRTAVRENLTRVKRALGLERLVGCSQVHGDTIHQVNGRSLEPTADGFPVVTLAAGDALITNSRGVGLLIKIADCQAVFLVDPVRQVIANVHCGWRGSVSGLLVKVVRQLIRRYGSHPEDLVAAISPSLGPCCAEFRNHRQELPPAFLAFQARPEYFDFWAISRWQLVNAGLRPEHIEAAGRCTVCESERFFSYRAEGTTGRLAAVLGWR